MQLDENFLAALDYLREFVFKEENRISLETLKKMRNGSLAPIGDDVRYRTIGSKYRVALSIEEQPFGYCLHGSISDKERTLVTINKDLLIILQRLGFRLGCRVYTWVESLAPDKYAMNFLQPLKARTEQLDGQVFYFTPIRDMT